LEHDNCEIPETVCEGHITQTDRQKTKPTAPGHRYFLPQIDISLSDWLLEYDFIDIIQRD